MLLNYEVDYIASHPTIAAPGEFEISDADYEDFKRRVIASGFTYDPESERALKQLKEIVKFEGYYDDAKGEFDALEKKLKHNIARDLDMHRDVLKDIISNDIVTAYYFQAGGVENSLKHDKQVQESGFLHLLCFPRLREQISQPPFTELYLTNFCFMIYCF